MHNICIIGAGYWGKNLIRNFNHLGVLTAVFDNNEKALDQFRNDPKYKHLYFDTDWKKCLGREDVDGVVIATPPDSHYSIAKECLLNGKNVFIEKPMTKSYKEAEELLEIANSKNLVVITGHIFLYSPEIMKLKEVISSEDFGKILYVYTQRLNLGKVQKCGVIFDLMPHDISVMDYLLNSRCSAVRVTAASHIIDGVEDVAFVNMKYGDVTVSLHLSWLDPLKIRNTIVVGTKQMCVCDSMNKTVKIYNKGVDLAERSKVSNIDYGHHLLSYRFGDTHIPYIETSEPLLEECKDFLACIDSKSTPKSSGQLGADVVHTLEAAITSLTGDGEWITI